MEENEGRGRDAKDVEEKWRGVCGKGEGRGRRGRTRTKRSKGTRKVREKRM